MEKYIIYHVKGVKVGCTCDWPKRIIDQGFTENECEILHEVDDVYEASDLEIKEQKARGYKVDSVPYFKSLNARNNWIRTDAHKKALKDGHNTPEYKQKAININLGENNPFYGRTHSEETIEQMKESARKRHRPYLTCPHCGIVTRGGGYTVHHGDRCKKKIK